MAPSGDQTRRSNAQGCLFPALFAINGKERDIADGDLQRIRQTGGLTIAILGADVACRLLPARQPAGSGNLHHPGHHYRVIGVEIAAARSSVFRGQLHPLFR